jgi:hypothetical protein
MIDEQIINHCVLMNSKVVNFLKKTYICLGSFDFRKFDIHCQNSYYLAVSANLMHFLEETRIFFFQLLLKLVEKNALEEVKPKSEVFA